MGAWGLTKLELERLDNLSPFARWSAFTGYVAYPAMPSLRMHVRQLAHSSAEPGGVCSLMRCACPPIIQIIQPSGLSIATSRMLQLLPTGADHGQRLPWRNSRRTPNAIYSDYVVYRDFGNQENSALPNLT